MIRQFIPLLVLELLQQHQIGHQQQLNMQSSVEAAVAAKMMVEVVVLEQ
jgi:hypothetical protein